MPTVHRPRYDLKVISRTSAPDVGGGRVLVRREPVWRRQHALNAGSGLYCPPRTTDRGDAIPPSAGRDITSGRAAFA